MECDLSGFSPNGYIALDLKIDGTPYSMTSPYNDLLIYDWNSYLDTDEDYQQTEDHEENYNDVYTFYAAP